jgi:alpha-amylase/alpha-mannosidase (GH57 family)
MSKNKFVCIHGHFYQPPRENPWLNQVELQDSAYPFHNWNERITEECYSRNAAARILGEKGRIMDIVNNYSRISFNFGPTLMLWLKMREPEVYQAILDADKESLERFSGHGSAIAQSFNHIIMPLANARDQETQVVWGIRDFEHRFKRKPEGMWLSETAVSTEVLEVLARHDIKFTILSPYQAHSFRKIGDEEWQDAVGARIDPRRPYLCQLPSGRSIALFFYDGPVSQGIAFEGLLNDGKVFADRLTGQLNLDDDSDMPQIMHIATDGETYGHHHRFGEMGLAFCLQHIENESEADITIYGEYLEKFPPEYEARIIENTAWSSTPHLERWSDDGGGNTGGHPDWHQKWRKPLRAAFDWLRDEMIELYEKEMADMCKAPWALRNAYVDVVLDRSRDKVEQFISRHSRRKLNDNEKVRFLKLLEIQHHCMLMYTSCGWFFDEVTGIETLQDIMYAARAIQLARDLNGKDYEKKFVELLAQCPSNLPEYGNAAVAYEQDVKPSIVDLHRVGAHYAVSSLFSDYPEKTRIYSFDVSSSDFEYIEAGKYTMSVGKATLTSEVTWEERSITYAIMHLGDHHLFGGVREFNSQQAFDEMRDEIAESFRRTRVHEVIVLMDKHFGTHNYSFWHLFKDDQKKLLEKAVSNTLTGLEITFRNIYEANYSLMQAMNELKLELPRPLKHAGDFTINARLKHLLEKDDIDMKELAAISESISQLSVKTDEVGLKYLAEQKVQKMMQQLHKKPQDTMLMHQVVKYLQAVAKLRLKPDHWMAQNIAFRMQHEYYADQSEMAARGDKEAKLWCRLFTDLIEVLNIRVSEEISISKD